jgi:hypothetical protein
VFAESPLEPTGLQCPVSPCVLGCFASSYRVRMHVEVEALTDQRLTEWLIGADSSKRADAWTRLVETLGRDEASRRWLTAFAAFDAAET